jgi:hypothetical protein
MMKQGKVERSGYGRYKIPPNTNNTPITNNTPNTSPENQNEGIRSNRGIRGAGEGETIRPAALEEFCTTESMDCSRRMCVAIQDEIRRGV